MALCIELISCFFCHIQPFYNTHLIALLSTAISNERQRTDNKADMRYMINMDYGADLPINTMGRRIRTRLYFTSESHLHTLLNVLRFAAGESGGDALSSMLSPDGIEYINNTRELCYLTQIVIRLFEDVSRPMDDPRRFRAEILFSPGATATPLHMDEAIRDADATRYDTTPLEHVARVGLTCTELEDYFATAICEGRKNKDDDGIDVASASTATSWKKSDSNPHGAITPKVKHVKVEKKKKGSQSTVQEGSNEDDDNDIPVQSNTGEIIDGKPTDEIVLEASGIEKETSVDDAAVESRISPKIVRSLQVKEPPSQSQPPNMDETEGKQPESSDMAALPANEKGSGTPSALVQKYFWSSVALGTLMLGAGCLVMAMTLSEGSTRYRRSWSRR